MTTVNQAPARRNLLTAIRETILASLLPEWRRWVYISWSALFVLLLAFILWPLAPIFGDRTGSVEGQIDPLNPREQALVSTSTPIEASEITALNFVSDPIGLIAPPAQAVQALPPKELFGVPNDRANAFDAMTAGLRGAQTECTGAINSDAAGAGSGAGAGASAGAQTAMSAVTKDTTNDRGVYHYHQGLIFLCGPNGASAVKQFTQAMTSYETFTNGNGGAAKKTPRQGRRLAQYQAVTGYGLGIAMTKTDASADAIDKVLADAAAAAGRVHSYGEPGPFVTMTASRCGRDTDCDLFNFTSAAIDNARLNLWLKHGKPDEAYERVGKNLAVGPQFVARYPGLAVNFAAAAAASGHFKDVALLYSVVRHDLDDNTGVAQVWTAGDRKPLARLAALAALASPEQVYTDGDNWWPNAVASSDVRKKFDGQHFDKSEAWFPPIALEDNGDVHKVDLWLWIRRDRALLRGSHYDLFRDDGAAVDNLGPGDRSVLKQWRRQVTGSLGDALLARAQVVRENSGLKDARPLLQLLGGDDFPWTVQARAKISLRTGHRPARVMIIDDILLLAFGLIFFLHMQFAIGYGRTFTRRHYLERTGRESTRQRPQTAGQATP